MNGNSAEAAHADEVRRADRARWLATVLAPPRARAELVALYAFNLELARTREAVSEPMLGQIRLQWWRETVDGMAAGTPRPHPVAEALTPALVEGRLAAPELVALIDAREKDLDPAPPETFAEFEAYCARTGGALNRLALGLLGAGVPAALEAGAATGTAWAMTGHLRNAAWLAAKGHVALPRELLAREGVAPEALTEGRPGPGLARVAEAVAAAVRDRLAAARARRREVPRAALPVLATARLNDAQLRALARAGYDLFSGKLEPAPVARPWAVLRSALTGRY